MKNCKKINWLVIPALMLFMLLFSSCKATNTDALSFYGGVVHNCDYTDSNYRWKFSTEPAYDQDGNIWGFELYISDKDETNTKKIPAFPTSFNRSVEKVFATQNYLYLITYDAGLAKIERVDLNDYSTNILYEDVMKAEKVVFGLSFSFDRLEKRRGMHPDFVFSNDKDVFFTAYDKGVFKVMPDNTAKNIISDKIHNDVAYDGNYIFYITVEGILKQYEIKSGKTEILTDKTVTPYTLKVTKEDITFESDKEKVTIKRKF